jgi:predicted nuclease with TOPRIM domain
MRGDMTPDQERLIRIEEGVSFIKETLVRDRQEVADLKKRVDIIEPKVAEATFINRILNGTAWLFSGAFLTYLINSTKPWE